MKLILKNVRNKEGVIYIKKYQYGKFLLRVEINPDNSYTMKAEDEYSDIEILAATGEKPIMSMIMMSLTLDKMKDFIERVVEAKELMEIIENNVEVLLERE